MNRDDEIFADALARPASERRAFVAQACGGDQAAFARVEAMLALDVEAQGFLETPLISRRAVTPEEKPGDIINCYKLLQKIGEGGFGAVWMAEQHEPIKRRVALKIIKIGMDTREVVVRFEAERQALAMMEHPNIAHVIDAGTTNAGRPFFVMELVRGVAITRYCDENRISAADRLRLFITVCQAVQHAHQKGVIHRDLKPSNILVTLHDGVPVPKVIDFGIAKATGVQLTEKTLFTQFHAFIGTPAYTSPEQMEMSGLDVDTRSDIYSLGVLLYELLTGQPPFDSAVLIKSGLEAMRRTIREVDPPRPSHCLATLSNEQRRSVACQRNTDAERLSLLLRGDLDWIAMRCLEKDRTRRYDSAASLAADVARHLIDKPVEARPPSRIYRTKKIIRRHKLGVFAVTGVVVSLLAGLIASYALYARERAAHGRASLAEKQEGELRRIAELAEDNEVKRAARTALDLANRNLADGRVADGLAYLVYAARKDPANPTLGPRLVSALATHNFLLPEGAEVECGARVLAVRFTRDGRSVHVGTEDGTFWELDAQSGRFRHEVRLGRPVMLSGWEFPRANDTVFAVRFADNTLGVFEVESGRPRWPPRALHSMVWKESESLSLGHAVGISPDGRWVYALASYRFWIWDAATGDVVLHPESGDSDLVGGCDFTSDGSTLAVTVGGVIRRWNLPDGREAVTPPRAEHRRIHAALPVVFLPDGRQIAVSYFLDGISILDASTGALIRKLSVHGDYVHSPSVGFASNHRVFAAGSHASGSWDLASGEFRPLPIGLSADVIATSFDAAGRRILTTGTDGFVRLCDLETGEQVTEPAWRQQRVFCAALSPDGTQVIIGTEKGSLQRLRVGRGAAQPLVLPRDGVHWIPPPFMAESPSRLLWLGKERAHVIDMISGRITPGGFPFPEAIGGGSGLYLDWDSPVRSDTRFMVVRTRKGWQAWELGPSGLVHTANLEGSEDYFGPVRFSRVGDLVALRFYAASAERGKLRIWNLRTGACAGPDITHPSEISDLTPNFSPDGTRIALGTRDGSCMIVEVATARVVVTFATRALVPNVAVWFSPDGARVLTANLRNETRIWNAVTGQPISPVMHTDQWWGGARFSPDGQRFATW